MHTLQFPAYISKPSFIQQAHKEINSFAGTITKNVDAKVLQSFGERVGKIS